VISFLLDLVPGAKEGQKQKWHAPQWRTMPRDWQLWYGIDRRSVWCFVPPDLVFCTSSHIPHGTDHTTLCAPSRLTCLLTLLLPLLPQATRQHTKTKCVAGHNGNETMTMAFILRRTATSHAHAHAAAARAIRTTSQRAMASSSTDFSKPSK
jgi:hypothetical protein